MKRLPLILSALFLAITLARVASFAQHELRAGYLGWVFSIALGVAVYACAYWTRVATTRRQAVAALVLFVSLDAFFNFAHVWLSADTSEPLIATGAVLYGLFPTLAVALLGWLAGAISRLPPGVGERSVTRIEQAAAGRLAAWIETRTERQPEPAKAETMAMVESEPTRYICGTCGISCHTQNGLNAHQRAHREQLAIVSNNGHKEGTK